jgi:hypothetical protein
VNKPDKDRQGIILIVAIIACVLAVFGFRAMHNSKPQPREEDNCIEPVVANTVILLDISERLNDQTRDEIIARGMKHILDKTVVNERVSIFTVSDLSKKALKAYESKCRPPDTGNRAVENVKKLAENFRYRFHDPLLRALQLEPQGSKESPIAQAVTDISLSQFLRGDKNSLLIFSDMFENTPAFSMYRCSPNTDVVAKYRESRRGAMERPQFKNTSVALHLIPHAAAKDGLVKCRDKLWPWFFGDNAGAVSGLTIDYLPGGTPMDGRP